MSSNITPPFPPIQIIQEESNKKPATLNDVCECVFNIYEAVASPFKAKVDGEEFNITFGKRDIAGEGGDPPKK